MTEFSMICSGWQTSSGSIAPLEYKFFSVSNDGSLNQKYFGPQSTTPAVPLDVGEPPSHNVTILVQIIDSYQSRADYFMYVKVRKSLTRSFQFNLAFNLCKRLPDEIVYL